MMLMMCNFAYDYVLLNITVAFFKGVWLVKDSTFIYNDHDCSCLNEELPKGSGFTVFERHRSGFSVPRSAV